MHSHFSMAITTICYCSLTSSSSSSSQTITSLALNLKSLRSLPFSLFPTSAACSKFGACATPVCSNEVLSIAAATTTKAVEPATGSVVLGSGFREVWFDGECGNRDIDKSFDSKVRRKKRRKRRKGFEYLEVKEEGLGPGNRVAFESIKAGYLSPAEEAEFCQCLKDCARLEAARRRIAETQKHEPTLQQLSKALKMEKRLVDEILCKGRESRERITCSYRKLVVSIASVYQGKGLSLQDLIQEGSIGLLRGAEKFDPSRGCKLSTYAYWWIKEAIITAISKKSRLVRLPRSTEELVAKFAEASNVLRQSLERMPSDDDIAKVLNVHVSMVRLGFGRSCSIMSLDRTVTDRGCMTLQEIIPGPDEITPQMMVMRQIMKQELEKLLQTVLTEREAYILRLNFGLTGQTPQSCDEIARLLKLSRERVRQINSIALSKLKQTSIVENLKELSKISYC